MVVNSYAVHATANSFAEVNVVFLVVVTSTRCFEIQLARPSNTR